MEAERLPPDRAFVPAGFFFGWAVEAGLHNEEELLGDDVSGLLRRFSDRELTAARLFHSLAGMLDEETLNDSGYAFAEDYVGWNAGQYFDDFRQLLARQLPTVWHVEDTWANYDRMKAQIEARYRTWLQHNP
uniref:DUF7832 domain-containing protein n=1 Tax=Rhizocola hellebori TaxID=1392758 RepID=UPI00194454EB|nr:hypothetical protein [Rhizocola hellebori]